MQIRVVEKNDELLMLFKNGLITPINKDILFDFFKNPNGFSLQMGVDSWNLEAKTIENYEANTIAYINDYKELCILDMSYFKDFLIDSDKNIDSLLSVSEYADAVGRTQRQILAHLNNGRIEGARKIGRDWFIPKNQVEKYPKDNRIVTGEYIKRK